MFYNKRKKEKKALKAQIQVGSGTALDQVVASTRPNFRMLLILFFLGSI